MPFSLLNNWIYRLLKFSQCEIAMRKYNILLKLSLASGRGQLEKGNTALDLNGISTEPLQSNKKRQFGCQEICICSILNGMESLNGF